jgi:hypothetical protein
MIGDHQADYKELLEEVRHRYRQKYDVVLDDEILYLVIRMNEMQVDLKNQIRKAPNVTFQRGIDYFWYGVGKTVGFLIFGVALIIIGVVALNIAGNKKIASVMGKETIKVEAGSSKKVDTTRQHSNKKL